MAIARGRYTYRDTTERARAFAARLHAEGIVQGQHVVIWSENRPEWIVALWGCLLRGVVLVPIDYRASADFLQRVARIVDARAVLVGDAVPDPTGRRRADLEAVRADVAMPPRLAIARRPSSHTPDDVAEMIFTSGATSEPKGVVLTHRNILANIVPIEREIGKYKSTRGRSCRSGS